MPARLLGEAGGERVAARVEIGGRRLRFGQRRLGGGEPLLELRAPLLGLALGRLGPLGLGGERFVLGRQPRRHLGRVGDQRLFALQVLRPFGDVALELGDARLGALLLLGERVARQRQPVQRRADPRFLVAQRRQIGGGDRLQPRRFGLGARALGDVAHVGVEPALGLDAMRLALAPGDQPRQRLVAADVLRQIAIAVRLARLALEAVDLRVDLLEDVVDPQQIVLCPLEPQSRPRGGANAGRRRRPPPRGSAAAPAAWRR